MHEYTHPDDLSQGSSAMTGFLVGALVGAGLALLLAPASGAETRRRLGETAKRVGENTKSTLERARGVVDELREDAKHAIDTGRETFTRGRQARATGMHDQQPGYSEARSTS